jgi:hypothetical protein
LVEPAVSAMAKMESIMAGSVSDATSASRLLPEELGEIGIGLRDGRAPSQLETCFDLPDQPH